MKPKMWLGLPLLAVLAIALLSTPAFAQGRQRRGNDTPAGCNGFGCWHSPSGHCNGFGCR